MIALGLTFIRQPWRIHKKILRHRVTSHFERNFKAIESHRDDGYPGSP